MFEVGQRVKVARNILGGEGRFVGQSGTVERVGISNGRVVMVRLDGDSTTRGFLVEELEPATTNISVIEGVVDENGFVSGRVYVGPTYYGKRVRITREEVPE